MNILITGITGLFGSQLAREFSRIGTIYGLVREGSDKSLLKEADFPIVWRTGELADAGSLLEAMQEIDLVIHAAGMVSFSSRDENALFKANSEGTAHVVNAMLQAGVNRLVYVSSVAAIGRSLELKTMDESYRWTDSPLNTPYAVSKYLGEKEVWRGEQEGLQVLVVNPSILLGKASDGKSSAAIYSYVLNGHSYFPTGDLNYIDVRDAAVLTCKLVEEDAWGQRYILSAGSISYRDFFWKVAKTFGKKAPHKALTGWMISFAVFFSGFLRLFGGKEAPLTKQTAMLSQRKIHFSNQKINDRIAYRYRSLEDSLDWAKEA